MNKFMLLTRLYRFRDDLVLLWRGFLDPLTTLYLNAAMIGLVVYLISPLDIIPDVLPFLGIADDVAIIAFAVGWIAKRLPDHLRPVHRDDGMRRGATDKTIDGTARRR